MVSSLGVILYSFFRNFYSPRSWILITQIVCNAITQIHVLIHRKQLQNLIEEILSNVPKKQRDTLNRLSWISLILFLLLTISDLAKVFTLWMIYGSIAFINNFISNLSDFNGVNSYLIGSIVIKLFIDSSIAISWFINTLLLYIYIYWSLKYLNQALLGYINRVLTNEKAEDVTNTIYAFRKVYDMKKRFNSLMNLIPFIWYSEVLINLNVLMYDGFVKADKEELMCFAFNLIPVIIHSVCLFLFTIVVVWLYNADRYVIDKIIRIICLESSRREKIAKLQAFLKEAEIFPTIQPDALNTFYITPGMLAKFILLVVNNFALWLIITNHGRSIIGMKPQ